ncbi:hypothetical protein V1L52_01485 [Treponema sp. HNW]|uniref:hypothetical protein n=1 Tax=Treponema sp. HNW TaxID=3116654 RepID=UPI003D0981D1
MKIQCCFAVKAPTGLSWPGILADYENRKRYYTNLLNEAFGKDFEFIYSSLTAQASDEDLQALTEDDGFIMILLAHGTGLGQRISPMLKHGLIIDDPYGGSGDIIRTACIIKEKNYPVGTVGTEDVEALIHKIRIYLAVPKVSNSRILVFKNFEKMTLLKEAEFKRSIGTGSTMKRYRAGQSGFEETVNKLKQTFGIDVVVKTLKELNDAIGDVDEKEAEKMAQKWIDNAEAVVEPSYADIRASAKMYFALKKLKEEVKADVVSVDCILLFFAYDLNVYPCLSFFEMNNSGQIGVCEGDLDACVTALIIRAVAGRPGLVSDPFVDTEKNQIVYSHCVASCKPLGPDKASFPYKIRTHAEDNASAALQVIMPVGHPLTTIKISTAGKAMSVHSGESIGNIDHPCGCRTKLVGRVKSSRQIMENWHNELFSWHRVTVFGDYRNDFIEIAKYLGLTVYEEDNM